MARALKKLLQVMLTIVLVAVCVGIYGIYYLRGSLPSYSGAMHISGLLKKVKITRDAEGVPHIFGHGNDVFIGLGFAHVQDRLWQMEMLRRAGQGRLSEIFGKTTLQTDIFLRTLNLYKYAQSSYVQLTPKTQSILKAYARGVNAWINRPVSQLRSHLPSEFVILGHKPEPWMPEDSLVVLKMMAYDLGANLSDEVRRLALAADGRTPEEINELMPPHRDDTPPKLPDLRILLGLKQSRAALGLPSELALLDGRMGSGASNNWVVDGSRTVSGQPLLANDPHLNLTAPSIWYLAHLAFEDEINPTTNLLGAGLPGTPLIVLGRNDKLAWGLTNAEADVQDLFIEKLNPDNSNQYKTPDGWRTFDSEQVKIKVKGEEDYIFTRRVSRHGPVLPDFYMQLGKMLPPGHVAALQWTALSDDDQTMEAGIQLATAASVPDYIKAMRKFHVPMQGMVVASVDNQIGFIAPGRIPLRDTANSLAGRAPAPGWEALYDWRGYLAFEDLPRNGETAPGAILTANSKIVRPNYPHHLTYDWTVPYRQDHIASLLQAQKKHDIASFKTMQSDVFSPAIAKLKPLMVAAARMGRSQHSAILDALSNWDNRMVMKRAEPLIMAAWMRHALKRFLKDDISNAFSFFEGQVKADVLTRMFAGQLNTRNWCDEQATDRRETCIDIAVAALDEAVGELSLAYGSDWSEWQWGKAHQARSEHRPFSNVDLLAWFFEIRVPSPGGVYTLNRGLYKPYEEQNRYLNRNASSYRAIYDLSNLDESLYMHSTGQSGNPLSQFYRNMVTRWVQVEYIKIPTNKAVVTKTAIGTWTLSPLKEIQ